MSTSVIAPPRRPEIKTELPGPNGRKIVEADAKFVTPSDPRPSFKLVAERGSGVWVEDVDGNLFLDCNAGVAVCSTGHCHPEVVKAIQEQADVSQVLALFTCLDVLRRTPVTEHNNPRFLEQLMQVYLGLSQTSNAQSVAHSLLLIEPNNRRALEVLQPASTQPASGPARG